MKQSVKITASILVMIFAFSGLSFGQDQVQINRTKKFKFNEESSELSVKIVSSNEYNYLKLNIQCQLYTGTVKVEVFDPIFRFW